MPIFRVKSVKKIIPAKKNLHKYIRGVRDKYEVWAPLKHFAKYKDITFQHQKWCH